MKKRYLVIRDGRYPLPQAGMAKELPEIRVVSDEEVARSVERVRHLLVWKPSVEPDSQSSQRPHVDEKEKECGNTARQSGSEREQFKNAFLVSVATSPGRFLVEHWAVAGCNSGSVQRAILDEVQKEKLAVVYTVQMGRVRQKHPVGTPLLYEKLGLEPPQWLSRGRGGFVHSYICRRAAEHYREQGHDTGIERGHVDVLVVEPESGERTAVEIELRDIPHVLHNVRRDFEQAMADRVIVAVEEKALLKKVEKRIGADASLAGYAGRIDVVLFSHFVSKKT